MSDVTNLDEATKCLEIAQAALQIGNLDKALRFAEKAMKLHAHDEARKLLRVIRSKQGGTSSSTAGPPPTANGTSSSATSSEFRRRAGPSSPRKEDRSTPEQRELVASILKKRDFYEVLGVQKGCSEEDVKRAYKKLALKLHPDKNTAPRSDEAFKVVSKAFSCLSDANKRAAYDRYGEEQPGITSRRSGGPFAAQGFDDFDPNEIFNMFFGGFPGNRNAHVFRTHFGGGGGFPGGQRQPQGEPASLPAQLLHLLPVVAMLLFTFFAFQSSEPVFSLDRAGEFQREVSSQRYNVPFFVKTSVDFDRNYPRGSRERSRIEHDAEAGYKERLDRMCYSERINQQRMYRWGQSEKARDLPLRACKEIVDRFGNQYAYQASAFGY